MTPLRVATVLLALATVTVAALILAAANYHDDAPQQPWQYEVGMTTFRFGAPALFLAAIIALIWMRRTNR